MDQYILFLCKELPSAESKIIIADYIRSLQHSENEVNYFMKLAPHVAPLLHQNYLYATTVRLSTCEDLENITWNKLSLLTEDNCITDVLFQDENTGFTSCSPQQHLCMKETQQLSQALHSLADQLPPCGTYKLDVIINYDVLENNEVSQHMDLSGSLYRLITWHGAYTCIIQEPNIENASLQEWYEILGARVITRQSIFTNNAAMWRGSIQLGSSESPDSIQLKGFQLVTCGQEVDIWTTLKKITGLVNNFHHPKGSILISSRMDVLDECDYSTIPPYLISPTPLQLCINHHRSVTEESHNFLDYINTRPGISLVLRLQFSTLLKPLAFDPMFSTEKWKKAVISGDIQCSERKLQMPKHLTFILTSRKHSTSSNAVVYPLRDPSDIKVDFYHKLISTNFTIPKDSSKEDNDKKTKDWLKQLPHLSAEMYLKYKNILRSTQIKVFQDWCDAKKEENQDNKCSLSEEELKFISSEVTKSVHSKLESSFFQQTPILERNIDEVITRTSLDPSDWPERIALLHRQFEADKIKKYHSSDTLAGLIPPLPVGNDVSIGAKDIGGYFQPSGEAKNPATHLIKTMERNKQYLSSFQQINQIPWPEIIHCKYHDLYYNNDISSDYQEDRSNRIKDRYLAHETASLCNNQQAASVLTTVTFRNETTQKNSHSSSHSPISKAYKSRKRKLTPSKEQSLQKFQDSNKYNRNGKKKCLIDSFQSDSSHSPKKPQQALRRTPCKVKSKSSYTSDHLRRSPRKHVSLSQRQPYVSRNETKYKPGNTLKETGELSEKHKMKLREAVAIALEKYDITLNHPSFKSCGRKLFAVCKAFVKDVIGKGNTSAQMRKIAEAHAKQVVEFEMQMKS